MSLQSTINYPLELILRLFGIWPRSSYPVLKSIVWTLLLLTFLVFQYWYCISHVKSTDLTDLLDGLSITLSNTLVLLKLIVIWLHNRTFCDILTAMFEDWNNCASLGEKRRIMIHKANLSSRISNVLITYFFVTFVLYAGITLALLGENNDGTQTRKYFIKMEFPFDVTTLLYSLILVLQFLLEGVFVLAAAMSIALIATLVFLTTLDWGYLLITFWILHVGSQIEIFCQTLTEVPSYSGKEESRVLIFKDLVCRHQRIIMLSENIQKMFKYISLGQFLSNMVVIGFISFLLAVSSNMEQGSVVIVKCFPYYVAVNCEAFILCYTGQYLSEKSDNITEVVYDSLWYELNPREARIILLVIMRSQKQLKLTAAQFMTLSLEAFANMLKASASYVSVLLAIYWS